jgi:hypothetical protein
VRDAGNCTNYTFWIGWAWVYYSESLSGCAARFTLTFALSTGADFPSLEPLSDNTMAAALRRERDVRKCGAMAIRVAGRGITVREPGRYCAARKSWRRRKPTGWDWEMLQVS